jgi:serine/threonine-protein kinase
MAKTQPTERVTEDARARIGREIKGQWTLDELIGVGGMAAVYAATRRDGGRVAIKMLHPNLSAETDLAARLVREASVANRVDHHAVVHVLDHDVDEADGAVFLVMDLLRGEPLSEQLARKRTLPPIEALGIMETVLEALSAAHAKGIVHRDIKPENIFITTEHAVRLVDFGIARVDEPGFSMTKTGHTQGTPEFMAPEQALGQRNLIDARTDVYACGATLFVLLTGKTPHEAETPQLAMIRVATQPARHIQMVQPELPECVANVVDQALEFEQKNRYPDAAAMLIAVRGALAELRSSIKPTPRQQARAPAPAPVQSVEPARSNESAAPAGLSVPVQGRRRVGWVAVLAAALLVAGVLYALMAARSHG